MALYQLSYMSSLVKPDSAMLRTIVDTARRRNKPNQITGMLLCCDGQIVQVLEGPQAAVKETFERIVSDTRHHCIVELTGTEVEQRDFEGWSMGFHMPEFGRFSAPHELGWLFTLSPEEVSRRVEPGLARSILRNFGAEALV